jgi:hypothetical protein
MKKVMNKLTQPLLALTAALLCIANAEAQQKQNLNVAIFLYDRVELLDFAGPG